MKERKDPISGFTPFTHGLKAFMINKREVGAAKTA
jgi:hypothetical protein